MPIGIDLAANLDRDVSPLVVSAVIADGLAAGAKARHRNADTEKKIIEVAVGFPMEPTLVVHDPLGAGHWRCALNKVGELHLYARTLGLKLRLQISKKRRHRPH